MKISHVTVIGAGQMGSQIGLNAALHGYQVAVYDTSPQVLSKAADWAEDYLASRLAKGKLTEENVAQVKSSLAWRESLAEACAEADLVIEAIVEKEDIKQALFMQLDTLCKPTCILTSNSSFIPSSRMAHCTSRPDKVANLHYFNPALVMELVEVVQGEHTSNATAETLMEFSRNLKKKPIWIKKEIDGFVANRIVRAVSKEAWFLVNHGYVTPQEVDIAAEKGLNHPMGPFRLMDMIGLDIAYLSAARTYEQSGNETDKPNALLAEKYERGEFGRKTGKGWYDYS